MPKDPYKASMGLIIMCFFDVVSTKNLKLVMILCLKNSLNKVKYIETAPVFSFMFSIVCHRVYVHQMLSKSSVSLPR